MSFSIGIVGLPNVGKSTLFKALTKKQVDISNYPFCTISPNTGVVAVPDERLERLAHLSNSAKIIPTVVTFVDIAGLVAGASKGEGLGNQFLQHIREVDAIVEVVRAFEDPDIVHVHGRINPASDMATIDTELCLADLATVDRRYEETKPKGRSGDKMAIDALPLYEKLRTALNAGQPGRNVLKTEEERAAVRDLNLLTAKPILYVYNISERTTPANIPEGSLLISAKIEAELADLPDTEARAYLKELGLEEPGLNRLIRTGYTLLDLITFFTSGPKETRAWTVKRGSKAPQAAGVIHSDFERGFIRAEVIATADLLAAGSEAEARAQGKLRLEGKNYVIQDGDVIHVHFA